jgi:hypothetical protein
VEKWDAFRLSANHQPSHLLYQIGQLGDVGGDASGFVAGEQVRCSTPA